MVGEELELIHGGGGHGYGAGGEGDGGGDCLGLAHHIVGELQLQQLQLLGSCSRKENGLWPP